jgi:hypothetical protein
VLEHAILMDARFVGEGVGTHHCLVRLHRIAGDLRHQLGGRHDLGGIDPRFDREDIRTRAHRHDDFFERGIAGPLAQAVDRALDLARTGQHGSQ